jgi:hypothetical protein
MASALDRKPPPNVAFATAGSMGGSGASRMVTSGNTASIRCMIVSSSSSTVAEALVSRDGSFVPSMRSTASGRWFEDICVARPATSVEVIPKTP